MAKNKNHKQQVQQKQKEQGISLDGVITEALPNTLFRVRLQNDHIVLAMLAGKLRENFIRIVPGDRVVVEVSPYDLSRGRITYRHKN